jgi:hypothetical protein
MAWLSRIARQALTYNLEGPAENQRGLSSLSPNMFDRLAM